MKIFIIEDDSAWSAYYRGLLKLERLEFFQNGVDAVNALADAEVADSLPSLIILDLLLTGPSGFAVLNELQSYPNLAKIPVVLVSSVAIPQLDNAALAEYGVVACLDKAKMLPDDILNLVARYKQEADDGGAL